MTSLCVQRFLFIGFGALFFVAGILLSAFWPAIYRSVLKPELVLANNSRSFDMWKETPVPIYMEIYFFHWANPERTLDGTEKPKFIEKGPYVFNEHHSKVNVTWNTNSTVTYKQVRKWVFLQNMTKPGLSLDDKITTVNPISLIVSSLLKKKNISNTFIRGIINTILEHVEPTVYVTKPVRELLFDGYEDNLLSGLHMLHKYLPELIPLSTDKFGWFYQHNMSSTFDGVSNMGTGADDLNNLGNVRMWNFKNETGFFQGECGKVKGSTGEIWPPNSSKKDSVWLFASDLCSSINLKKNGTATVQGVDGSVFIGAENVFDNGTLYPENKCYVANGTSIRTGVRSLSSCRFGAPILISFPHFYLADPAYAQAINGVSPSAAVHQFKINLEDHTGIPLTVNARLQINVQSSPTPGYNLFEKLPEVLLPVIWFNQHMDITPEMVKNIWVVSVVPNYITIVLISIAVVGAVLLLSGIVLEWRDYKRGADPLQLLKDSDEPILSTPPNNDQEPSQ